MKHKLPKHWPPIIILALVSLAGIVYLFFYFYPSQELLRAFNNNDKLEIAAAKYINGLDGKVVSSKADSAVQVVGVMIDNHPDSRPQSGLSQAKIVYEAPVEGGLTRYLAIFDNKQAVIEAGPVRSARGYFLDWLQEYGNGLYMHSGGSPEALGLINSRKIFDANEFYWGQYYWRSQRRQAPHNLYTNTDNWQKVVSQYGNTSTLFTADKAWKYTRIIGKTIGTRGGVKIPFSTDYEVVWTYDAKKLNYVRSVNDKKETDKDGSEVRARNILVQITNVQDVVSDDKGRKVITTVGKGTAIILKKGNVSYGTWKKTSLTSRTRFYDKNGKEVMLVPGNTWVEVVPKEVKVQVTN
ncbi:MAG: hypothetical protein G01um101413_799 [Parcubacteria group bacterium Gr01-1014_13]|nr:MAG: hypothetical protein G01um101413_799 [Parcubacteria group bacterium Gr01-1014_13]